jgi:hypothetical protein
MSIIGAEATQQILDTNIPFATLVLILDEPETVRRNLDRGATVSLYRWHCGCRAVCTGDLGDIRWCAVHAGHVAASRRPPRGESQ